MIIRCETGNDVTVDQESLEGADLRGAELHRALLDGSSMRGADLSSAILRSASLGQAVLDDAILLEANLAACRASRASFRGAVLVRAFMRAGDFEGADFSNADLSDADLGLANLKSAILCGARMTSKDLAQATLTGAIADESTEWPPGFDPGSRSIQLVVAG